MWRTLKEIKRELEKRGGEVREGFSKEAELGWVMDDKKEWNSTCKGPVVGEIFDELRRDQSRHSGWREHGGKYNLGRDACKVQGEPCWGFGGVIPPAVTVSWRASGRCHSGLGWVSGSRKDSQEPREAVQVGDDDAHRGPWQGDGDQTSQSLNPWDQQGHGGNLSQGNNQTHMRIYIQISSLWF